MSLDLDAIKARADAATREPWHVEYFGDAGYPQRIANEAAVIVADLHEGGGYPAHNAEFIAHAREDVPALVAEVARLRAAVAGVRVLAEQADKFGLCLDDGKALREALDGVS